MGIASFLFTLTEKLSNFTTLVPYTSMKLDNFYKPGLIFTSVVAMNDDEVNLYNLPAKGWYNVIAFCTIDDRVSQVAIQCFCSYGGASSGDTYIRTKHDDIWYPWRKITMQ